MSEDPGPKYSRLTETEKAQITNKLVTEPHLTYPEIARELEVSAFSVRNIARVNKWDISRKAAKFYESVGDLAIEVSENIIRKAHTLSKLEISMLTPEQTRFQEKQGLPAVDRVMDSIIGSEKSQSVHIKTLYQQNTQVISPIVLNLLGSLGDKLKMEEIIDE